ncbi:TipAS antibiotic-recognition domain-containing protein [Microbacterium sp. 10M-3C3]|jgi:DNA-binding transcriptional MerR regulator|uniref:TipAS antibiotic-recognition domain-containing protein n=1 Tax=Microbacterium sp. 10M-3C3 TaxID=2483401 RepID=UPI000F64278D|nr:TipAS antibiotic-recognition domain-containing protein [Microbacterium sp. 10M-3C3]
MVTRLQRILLLRALGLGLPDIARVLRRDQDEQAALTAHLDVLRDERARLDRRITAVETTIRKRKGGETPMAEEMFDGFDHTAYKDEVTERWGADAYARGDAWWRGLSAAERDAFQRESTTLAQAGATAAESGADPAGVEAAALAERHVAWLRSIPGTPANVSGGVAGYLRGLGDMYVADPRFGRHYATADGGDAGARFIRDALHAWADARE